MAATEEQEAKAGEATGARKDKAQKDKVNSSLKVESNPEHPIFDEINEMVNNQSTNEIISRTTKNDPEP